MRAKSDIGVASRTALREARIGMPITTIDQCRSIPTPAR